MVKIIDVCSGKGGVGKTTVTANLGVALQKLGKRVVVIDCNLTTSHLSLLFNSYSFPLTFNNFLRNECKLEETVYFHQSGLSIVPASLELRELPEIDVVSLKSKIKEVFAGFDVVLLDSAPGLGREALIALQLADEVLFVANPLITSLVDVVKCKQLINSFHFKPLVIGIILNRVRRKAYEISVDEVKHFCDLPVVGTVPEDEKILEATNQNGLVTLYYRNSSSSRAFFEIAAKLAGVEYKRKNFFERLKRIFRKKAEEDFNRGLYDKPLLQGINFGSNSYGIG